MVTQRSEARPSTASDKKPPLQEIDRGPVSYAAFLALVWSLLVLASLAWNLGQEEREILVDARAQARTALQRDLTYRRWFAAMGEIFVPAAAAGARGIAPGTGDDGRTGDGRQLVRLAPDRIARLVRPRRPARRGARSRLIASRPLHPENAPDPWEADALRRLSTGTAEEVGAISTLGGQRCLRLVRRLMADTSCAACHPKTPPGTLVGALSVAVPIGGIEAVARQTKISLGAWHAILWLFGMSGVGLATRRLQVRIAERDTARAVQGRLERRLHHVQTLDSFGTMAGSIAHEFNNMLTGIQGHASLLQMGVGSGDPRQSHFDAIQHSIDRASLLTGQMLACSGKGRFAVVPVNLSNTVQEIRNLLEALVDRNARVDLALDPHLPPVEADPRQIRQVLIDLVTNASEALGDEEGRIRISTGTMECDEDFLECAVFQEGVEAGAYAYVEVADTGCGMDQATMEKVCTPFFTTKTVGRGLGLPAVLGIARANHGTLHIDSQPGKGTTVRACFPVARPETKAAAPAATQAPHRPAEGGGPLPAAVRDGSPSVTATDLQGSVLVVDDEPMILEIARAFLEMAGLTVVCAHDGAEGVERLRDSDTEIDLVLLDATMPGMDGQETFAAMRRLRPDLPIVMISGYSRRVVVELFDEGLAGFVQKPFDRDELMAAVTPALESARTRQRGEHRAVKA